MGEKVDITVAQKIKVSRDGKEWYRATVQNVNENVIYIDIPYLREHPLVLIRGDTVQISFFKDDSGYSFETLVYGEITENIVMYRLAFPEHIERVQQRMYVRLPVILDVEYSVADPTTGKDQGQPRSSFTRANSVDISGGGMKLAVRQYVKENSLLHIKFTLPLKTKPEPLELKARVIRCINSEPGRDMFMLGLKYEEISLRQQDIIVRFIFEKTARQKRLL